MRNPEVQNKYNLTRAMIPKLIVDRSKITQAPFWRNDVVHAWCLSGTTAKNSKDIEFGTENEYWLGVYDEDAPAYAGKVRCDFTAYGGMCGYTFRKFFNPKEIENELDLLIQEKFISVMNQLLDEGVFKLPEPANAV